MTWQDSPDDAYEPYLALLKERCERDGLGTSDEVLARQFRLHLHRGTAYLAAPQTIRSVGDLVRLKEDVERDFQSRRERLAADLPDQSGPRLPWLKTVPSWPRGQR